MFFIPNLHQLSSRLFKLLATVLLVSLVAAYTYARSVNPPKNYLLSAGERLPWEHESSNPRVQDHLAAARFLTQLNFYEDGHGLVLPPSITKERLEASYSVEQLAEVSGLVHDDGRLYGLTEERVGSVDVLVAGCAACHIGKAAGRVIPGLGNKTFDIFGLAQATHQEIESASKFDSAMNVGNKDWERAHQAGQKSFLNLLNHPEYDSGTAGAITQYFAAAMAFEQMGMEPFETPLYAPAKAPILWGYGPKRRVGVFADGSLKGKTCRRSWRAPVHWQLQPGLV